MNQQRVQDILLIRDIRESIRNSSFEPEEKEVLKTILNYLEDDISMDIQNSYQAKDTEEELGIESYVDVVEIPHDQTDSRYIQYKDLTELDFMFTISSILVSFDQLFKDLDNKKKDIILKALRKYTKDLSLNLQRRKNSRNLYENELKDNLK